MLIRFVNDLKINSCCCSLTDSSINFRKSPFRSWNFAQPYTKLTDIKPVLKLPRGSLFLPATDTALAPRAAAGFGAVIKLATSANGTVNPENIVHEFVEGVNEDKKLNTRLKL